jgi:quercetin dioxygenase-like cupin family protein
MIVRRVVTGRDDRGRSVFVDDASVDPIELSTAPGTEWHRLWGGDVLPTLPTDGRPPSQPRYFPPPGGYRFGLFTLAPDSTPRAEVHDPEAARAEIDEKLPGMFDFNEVERPGMHTTSTVDFDLVLSGEIWLELDDGEDRRLRAGDCVVQNGTRHAWHNRSDEPCVLLVAILGAATEPGHGNETSSFPNFSDDRDTQSSRRTGLDQ